VISPDAVLRQVLSVVFIIKISYRKVQLKYHIIDLIIK